MARAYFWSLSDQGSLSAFHFLLGLALIRTWEPEDYGIFILWQGVAWFCVGIQTALVSTPLAVFAPAAESGLMRERIRRVMASANAILVLSFFAITLAAMKFIPLGESVSIAMQWVMPAFVASALIREYARAVGFASSRIAMVIWADGIYLIVAIGIPLVYWLAPQQVDLFLVFGFLTVGSTLGGIASILIHGEGSKAFSIRNFSFQAYDPIWKQGKWTTLGTVTTELHRRGYVYILTALVGTGAVGFLAAGELLFRPVALAVTAWQQIARPHLAKLAAESNWKGFVRTLQFAAAVLASCTLVFFAAFYLLWPQISTFLYGEKYAGIGWIVIGWGAVAAMRNFATMMSTALQSTKKFKPLAFAAICGCVVTLTSVTVIIMYFDFKFSIIGIMLGSFSALIYIAGHFSAALKNREDKSMREE